ncbi:TIR domain-containing protein [Aliarcobacter vitoriensis]|uniref:CD-NTase-associated protein 12/Pycsar effector protein TIR domain-containing protein n=1 Tax=Aliarcobacter vitoriensis TaxID=2011099 RepID=A0A366MSC4_9BACT|nr:nucleotide-binding protein [Aliarcobacter vitoriensis]RBQ28399.1 hypothetical protein CRU91_09265 [Aliarcobacter vitoriensis]
MTKIEALEKLNSLIQELKKLPQYQFNGNNNEFNKWLRKSKRYIEQIFENINGQSTDFIDIQFEYKTNGYLIPEVKNEVFFNHHMKQRLNAEGLIESFIEEVEEWDDDVIEDNKPKQIINTSNSNKVFIVHGHDNGAKQEVARFLEKLGLEPIILHEQASSQKTIIEKIESYAGEVGFGVVLYTACDIGGKDKDNLQSRARQNVVFEHGYLIGLLGRDKVCPLVKGSIETPGDISGVVYTHMDNNGSWHLPLAKELRTAGYTIDLNLLVG